MYAHEKLRRKDSASRPFFQPAGTSVRCPYSPFSLNGVFFPAPFPSTRFARVMHSLQKTSLIVRANNHTVLPTPSPFFPPFSVDLLSFPDELCQFSFEGADALRPLRVRTP